MTPLTDFGFTVSWPPSLVAVFALPHWLVKTARYHWPLIAGVGLLIVSVLLVLVFGRVVLTPPAMFDQVPSWPSVESVLTCHWTFGVGRPLATAVNVAVASP